MIHKEEIRDWVIYRILSPSGRTYIGKTSDYKRRIRQYRHCAASQIVLTASFKKYGFKEHRFEIIDSFTSGNDYANGKEIFWVRSYMSNVNKWPQHNGMNLTNGGDGQLGRLASEETKQKLRDAHKGRTEYAKGWKYTEGAKKKMSESRKGKPLTGKRRRVWTDEQRRQMSEMKMGRPSPNKGKDFSHLSQDERNKRFGKHNIGNSYNKGRKYV